MFQRWEDLSGPAVFARFEIPTNVTTFAIAPSSPSRSTLSTGQVISRDWANRDAIERVRLALNAMSAFVDKFGGFSLLSMLNFDIIINKWESVLWPAACFHVKMYDLRCCEFPFRAVQSCL